MIHAQPRQNSATHQDCAFVRALSSINPQQTNAVDLAVSTAGAGTWTTEVVDDYDGYRSILVEPNAAESSETCYFVSGTAQRLDLFKASEDQLTPIGHFRHVDELSAKLTSLLSGS